MNRAKLQLYLAYLLQLVMLASAAVDLQQQQWTAAGLTLGALALSLIPMLLRLAFGIHSPPPFLLLLVLFNFATLFLGEAHGLYRYFWWWDMALHFASGVLLGIVGFLLAYVLNGVAEIRQHMRAGFVAFFAFVFSVTVGAFWEVLEFVLDIFFTLDMQTEKVGEADPLADSMIDLLMDGIGALLTMLIVYCHLKWRKAAFLGRWTDEFLYKNPQLCGRR